MTWFQLLHLRLMAGPWLVRRLILIYALAMAWNAGAGRIQAGTDVLLGMSVSTSQRVDLASIQHSVWDALLKKYVNANGLVNYKDWKASSADVGLLDDYLRQLSTARINTGSVKERLAFWINAYNAVTVRGILREYPTSSIRNHTARLIGYNIWKDLKLQIDGNNISLDSMEHEILRKMGEPKIHFAIVCASIGCPPLRAEAYVASRLDEQLASNARMFLANGSNLQYNSEAREVALSPIFKWFAGDFGSSQSAQLKWIAAYAPAELHSSIKSATRVRYLPYDWGLNSQ